MTKRIVIAANTAWYLANFRCNLARALIQAGYEVVAMAPEGEGADQLRQGGIRFVPIAMDNKGTNPITDGLLLLRFLWALRREKPSVFLGYTVKPNVYGGLACRMLGIPSVHNVAGLGTAFIENTWLTRLVRRLYQVGLHGAAHVFFQNPDDLSLFLRYRLVPEEKTEPLPGSGVDTEWFYPVPTNQEDESAPFRFLLSARLLWDKGVGEYVAACRQLREEGRSLECQLLGFLDAENRSAISRSTIDEWQAEGCVRYLGSLADVRPAVAESDCVVLPSYREGTPRSLLEAASMARPVIATDAVGCREAVVDGETGFLCEPRDAYSLADRMREMMDLSEEKRDLMGAKGRQRMIEEFDESIVINRYLELVDQLAS